MARIVVIEKGLESRVETIIAQTRRTTVRTTRSIRRVASLTSSAMTALGWRNPLSSVPISISWTASRFSICQQAIKLGKRAVSKRWREACWTDSPFGAARSPGRKTSNRRPLSSTKPIAVNGWPIREREIDHPFMHRPLNMVQLTLACALGFEPRLPDFHWRPAHPKLCEWFGPIAARPSFATTAPPSYG